MTNSRFPILNALRKQGNYIVTAGTKVLLVNGEPAIITENKTITRKDFGVPTDKGLFIPKGILVIL